MWNRKRTRRKGWWFGIERRGTDATTQDLFSQSRDFKKRYSRRDLDSGSPRQIEIARILCYNIVGNHTLVAYQSLESFPAFENGITASPASTPRYREVKSSILTLYVSHIVCSLGSSSPSLS